MSVCDEGWKPEGEEDFWPWQCPCLDIYADLEVCSWKCNLNVFKEHDQFDRNKERQDLRPVTCEFAPILKSFLSGDYALFGYDDGQGYTLYTDGGWTHET